MVKARFQPLAIRLSQWAGRHVERRWLPPAVAVFPAADFVLPFMPNQLLLAGLSTLAVHRWPVFALAFAMGTALGGGAVAYTLQALAIGQSLFMNPDEATGTMVNLAALVQMYGLWYLAAIALLPWTPRLAVVVCALTGLSPVSIFATLLIARLVPCAGLGIIGAYGPRLAMRSSLMQRLMSRMRVRWIPH